MNRRILVIDDQEEILRDYKEILSLNEDKAKTEMESLEEELFGKSADQRSIWSEPTYELFLVNQGQAGFELVKKMKEEDRPIALAFIDMRMPTGWNGLETAKRIREIDPEIEIVIVTAYSDRDRNDIVNTVGTPSRLLYLKKPFDIDEIRQLALCLTEKWNLARQEKLQRETLKNMLSKISQLKHLGLKNLLELLRLTLAQLANLLDFENGFICSIKEEKLEFRLGIGKYTSPDSMSLPEIKDLEKKIIERGKNADSIIKLNGFKLIPFYVVEYEKIVLIMEEAKEERIDDELISIFMENVSAAIDTACLYERLYLSYSELEKTNKELENYKKYLEEKIKERTEELWHLNELHKSIIENAGLAIITFDEQFIIRSANQISNKILGKTPYELIGHSVGLLAKEGTKFIEAIKEGLEKGCPFELEYDLTRGSAREFPAHITISRISSNHNLPLHYIGLISDLSERKELEKRMLRSQKLESIGVLAGGVAHNFNNLLIVILNSLSELRNQVPNEPQLKENLDLIQKSSEQASELTKQLLSFSRQTSGKREVTSVEGLLYDVVSLLAKTVHKNIDIKVDLKNDELFVEGDRSMLEQALLNLGLNAKDAMPEGGTLCFGAENVLISEPPENLASGVYVKITVSDTGKGIPQEIMEHLFEPFYTTKEVNKGTGLGLATTYGIVKNHKGWISVDSEPGRGTRFNIYLPTIKEKKENKKEDAELKPIIQNSSKILLIDDEKALRRLAQIKLERLGYVVLSASSGEEAIEILKTHRDVSVAVMDMIMPGLSGKELFKALKEQHPNLKVIIITGYSDEKETEELFKNGADGYLQKPFLFEELASLIQRIEESQEEKSAFLA